MSGKLEKVRQQDLQSEKKHVAEGLVTPFEKRSEKYDYYDVRKLAPETCHDLAEDFQTNSLLTMHLSDRVC